MAKDAPVAPGDILLGKYRVERVLGKGGMGIVVGVRHVELDEMFAVKMMLPGVIASQEGVERFLREARAAAKLKGEHVAKVFDVGRLPDGTPYMVMEYLTGSDLKQLLREVGRLPPADAILYMQQACETLREAHGLGIVHRDVKAANMFLTRRPNGTPCLKVLDFGISKSVAADAVGLTATGTVGGSPLYMSPEQMRSAKYVDHRTDIWAIGVVLHELLTGKTPFHADTITAVAGRVLQDEPEPPSQTHPDLPRWLDAVVLRCLEKKPEQRYQTMTELMDALRTPLGSPNASVGSPISGADPGGDFPTLRLENVVATAPATTPAVTPTAPSGGGHMGKTESTTAGLSRSSNAVAKAGIGAGAPLSHRQRRVVIGAAVTLVGAITAAGAIVLFLPRAAPSAMTETSSPATSEPPTTTTLAWTTTLALVPTTAPETSSPTLAGTETAPTASVTAEPASPSPARPLAATAATSGSTGPISGPSATTKTPPIPAKTSSPRATGAPTTKPDASSKTTRTLL